MRHHCEVISQQNIIGLLHQLLARLISHVNESERYVLPLKTPFQIQRFESTEFDNTVKRFVASNHDFGGESLIEKKWVNSTKRRVNISSHQGNQTCFDIRDILAQNL
jgi:hypothetical protein